MKTLIKNGRVIDPLTKIDAINDVLIENGRIVKVAKNIKLKVDKVIDAKNKVVMPGLIDVHTHLREPGHEEEETIASGTLAAAHGGVTTVLCMPNTHPTTDNAPSVEFILMKAQKEGVVNVFPIGCITKESEGKELAEMGILKKTGVVAVSDDGKCVMSSQVMRRALEYSKMFDLPVVTHSEDESLSKGGSMNEGYISMVLGLKGIPNQSEDVIVSRDIMLAELTGGHLHVAHVSTRGSVELIRQAKKRKIKVTAETCPHYFTLTDEAVKNTKYDTNTKMKPPLRTATDVEAIKEGLADGTLDCIATDHAPHSKEEKNTEFDLAPFGIIGLETMFPLVITNLVNKKVLTLSKAIEAMTLKPARIFSLKDRGALKPGYIADITIADIKKSYTIKKEEFLSKSCNSPFIGMKVNGVVEMTIVGGEISWPRKENKK